MVDTIEGLLNGRSISVSKLPVDRCCGNIAVNILCVLLLLACAITHHSYVQSIVLEPCSRLIVQNNEAIDPLRWSVGQRPLLMWSAVCSAPQSQLSFVDNPQRSMLGPNLPVRSLFSRVQARRDRPTSCPLFDGVGMNLCSLVVVDAHDSAYLACVQCFTVSCGGTEDSSC